MKGSLSLLLLIALSSAVYAKRKNCCKQIKPLLEEMKMQLDELQKAVKEIKGNETTVEDIDECAEGSHDCDVNAYCNNTIGSYTCTCKATYFGNGKTCTSHRGLGASDILDNLDHKYSDKLISYLEPVLLSSDHSGFVRCWHAKTEGSAASTFHSNCDGKGPTVLIIKYGDYLFGGYTDVSWHSRCSYSSASKAFLFSLYNAKGYNPVKLTQYRNQQSAMYGCSTYGPTLGAGLGHDIYIEDNALNNRASYTKCGATYSIPAGYQAGDCFFFNGAKYYTPTDIEVFYEIVSDKNGAELDK
ncbi:hypothetical protein ACROYT_G007605 [Oculina patagonica]